MHALTPSTVCALIVIGTLAFCGVSVAADSDRGDRSQRARIQTERRDAQMRFSQQMSTCAQQFAAAACQDSARSERRAALDALRHQQLVLDDEQRRQRAAARLRSIQGKTAVPSPPHDEPAQAQPAASAAKSATPRRDRPPRASAPAAPLRAAGVAAPGSTDLTRSATASMDAERRRLHSERRASDSDRHRLEVGQRNAERDRKRPPAAGLPAPASSP